MTCHHTRGSPSCTIVTVLRDFLSENVNIFLKCTSTDHHLFDGSSCTTVTVFRDILPESLKYFSLRILWRTPMTVHHASDGTPMGPLCSSATATLPVQLYYMQVLTLMAPKKDRVYSYGHSKSISPSTWFVIGSNDERDLQYVPPGMVNPVKTKHHTLEVRAQCSIISWIRRTLKVLRQASCISFIAYTLWKVMQN